MKRMMKGIGVIFLTILLAGCTSNKIDTKQTSSDTPAFSLRDPDKVIRNTLLDPFVNKTKIKVLGDSITAGRGATGYGLTTERIGNSEYFVPKQDSLSWANLFKQYVEDKYNTSILVNPLDSQITSNFPRFENKDNDTKLKMSAYTKEEDAKWQFTFIGTEFNVYFTRQKDSSIVDVYVDGTLMKHQDLYSPTPAYGHKVSIKNLEQGPHHVEIRTAGNNSKSDGSRIYIEAIEFQKTAVVENWGVSGRDSEWMYELRDTLIDPDDDVVMIQIGSNDRQDMESPEALKMHVQAVIQKCILEKKDVILLSANPTLPKQDELGEERHFTMLDVDMTIKNLADEYGIKYISNYEEFWEYSDYSGTPIDNLLDDGQHPNDAGYRVIYKNVMRSLGLSLERE